MSMRQQSLVWGREALAGMLRLGGDAGSASLQAHWGLPWPAPRKLFEGGCRNRREARHG
jgi:hypothetical protein